MTNIRLLLSILGTCLLSFSLSAQDIHFSMFDLSPLTINPAQTGSFRGTVRLGGIYRSQWQSSNADFETISLYADSPVLAVGKKKRDWLGVGVSIVRDVAGRENGMGDNMFGGLETSFLMPSAAFHKVLDKKGDNVLTIGVQGGSVSRGVDRDNLSFLDEFSTDLGGGGLGAGNSADKSTLPNPEVNNGRGLSRINPFTDFSLGLLLSSRLSEESSFTLGAAFGHIVKIGGYNFIGGGGGGAGSNIPSELKRPGTLKFYGTYNQQITDQWSVHPMAFFQTTKGLTEVNLQSQVGYQLNDDFRLNGGLGYRLGDAAMIIGGVNYKDWRVGLNYDLTLGQTQQVGFQNAFEVGASYIIKLYKDPVIDPVIICPEF
ncbi:MAG: PorP/SprF family type IX secretion system membrane protein [Bacteroidota bacterium]